MDTKSGAGVTQALVDFAASVTFDDIPQEVVHQTKRIILDCIGCALGGYSSEKGYMSRKMVKAQGGNPDATIIGSGEKNSVVNATFVNANMGNAIDIDDTVMMTHPAVPTVMGALSFAEKEQVSGKDLITAVVTGYDIGARIGGASSSWLKTEDGYVRTLWVHGYSWHTFNSAVAAAKILKYDAEKMGHVFGLAGMFASFPAMAHWTKPIDFLPTTKYYEAGWTTQGGTYAALLAREGYIGPQEMLETKFGFWRMYGREDVDYEFMVRDMGKRWWIMETSFKWWPCCRFIHYSLTAFTKLIEEYDLKAEEIEKVLIKGSMLYQPIFYVKQPKTPANMQFSAPHALANAAFRVTPGPLWQHPETMDDPKMVAFRDKVSIEPNKETLAVMAKDLSGERPRQPKRVPTTVEVTARGKVFSETTEFAKGDPSVWVVGMELSDDELKVKYRNMAMDVLSQSSSWRAKTEQAINTIYDLEKVGDINELVALLAP